MDLTLINNGVIPEFSKTIQKKKNGSISSRKGETLKRNFVLNQGLEDMTARRKSDIGKASNALASSAVGQHDYVT